MTPAFINAVLDTLLPGDSGAGEAALPPSSAVGFASCLVDGRHAAVLALIADLAGGEGAFTAASPTGRADMLRDAERKGFAAFRVLVGDLLEAYYQHSAVLEAIGWRPGPAQPLGHSLAEADASTLTRLDKVRARGPIWRRVG